MLVKILSPDFTFEDERGVLNQLVHKGFNQVNVIFSKDGVQRGGHYHKDNCEAFFIISGQLRLTLQKGIECETHTFRENDFFLIETGILHSFVFLTDTLLVSMYDKGVENEDGSKDIFIE